MDTDQPNIRTNIEMNIVRINWKKWRKKYGVL